MSTSPALTPQAVNIDEAVGERIHTLMWRKKVQNKDVAELLGLDPSAIGKKLRAEQKFSVQQLVAIAAYLNSTVAYLVGETENPHQSPDGGDESRLSDLNRRPVLYKGAPSGELIDMFAWRAAA